MYYFIQQMPENPALALFSKYPTTRFNGRQICMAGFGHNSHKYKVVKNWGLLDAGKKMPKAKNGLKAQNKITKGNAL